MIRTVHAEWTKLRTLPANAWLLAAMVAATIAASAAAVAPVDVSQCASPTTCFEDTTKLTLTGVRFGQALVVVLAVLSVSAEFATGTIGPTLAATPRRLTVLLAKAVVVTATTLVASAVAVLGMLAVGRALLPGNGFPPPSLTDGPTLRAAVGSALYLALVALLALGVATTVRDGAAALTTVLTLLYLAPVLTALIQDPDWRDRLQQYAPMPAGLSIQATQRLDHLPTAPWTGLAVLAAYATAAMLLAATTLTHRDP